MNGQMRSRKRTEGPVSEKERIRRRKETKVVLLVGLTLEFLIVIVLLYLKRK